MRTTPILLFAVAACGGKLAPSGEPSEFSPPVDTAADPSPGTIENAPPGAPDLDGVESCRIVCDWFARCGTPDLACLSRCHADVTDVECGAASTTYFACFAARASECGPLADACLSSACAYAECKRRELPSYCR
jgi:hypothetical protein